MPKKKIIIVGGTSALGMALKSYLTPDYEVITAGRKNCDFSLDLSQSDKEFQFPKDSDIVIHTAANFGGKSEKEEKEAELVNVKGTFKVCQAAANAGAEHFILISSIFALLNRSSPYYSVYASTKKQSEEVAEHFCRSSALPLTILRPSQIYGNLENFKVRQPFLNLIIDKAQKEEEVTIYGSHDPKLNIIHITDLVKIIGAVIKNKVTGTYACMNPENITYSQFAKAAFKAFGKPEQVKFLKEKENIADNIFEKDNSLYEKINFFPSVTLEDGLKEIADFRTHQQAKNN